MELAGDDLNSLLQPQNRLPKFRTDAYYNPQYKIWTTLANLERAIKSTSFVKASKLAAKSQSSARNGFRRAYGVIEISPSNIAKCRICGSTLTKGSDRFGYPVGDPRGDYGVISAWLHMQCSNRRLNDLYTAYLGKKQEGDESAPSEDEADIKKKPAKTVATGRSSNSSEGRRGSKGSSKSRIPQKKRQVSSEAPQEEEEYPEVPDTSKAGCLPDSSGSKSSSLRSEPSHSGSEGSVEPSKHSSDMSWSAIEEETRGEGVPSAVKVPASATSAPADDSTSAVSELAEARESGPDPATSALRKFVRKYIIGFREKTAEEQEAAFQQLTTKQPDAEEVLLDDFVKRVLTVKYPPPEDLIAPLLPFQSEGLAWMCAQEMKREVRGGILADEMGMGKTVQMIALILARRVYGTNHPAVLEGSRKVTGDWGKTKDETVGPIGSNLVVAPLAAVLQWESEIERFTRPGSLRVLIYHGANRHLLEEELAAVDVVITTYSTIESDYRRILNKFKLVCKYCGKRFLPSKLRLHLLYICGPDAQRTYKQSLKQRKDDKPKDYKVGGESFVPTIVNVYREIMLEAGRVEEAESLSAAPWLAFRRARPKTLSQTSSPPPNVPDSDDDQPKFTHEQTHSAEVPSTLISDDDDDIEVLTPITPASTGIRGQAVTLDIQSAPYPFFRSFKVEDTHGTEPDNVDSASEDESPVAPPRKRQKLEKDEVTDERRRPVKNENPTLEQKAEPKNHPDKTAPPKRKPSCDRMARELQQELEDLKAAEGTKTPPVGRRHSASELDGLTPGSVSKMTAAQLRSMAQELGFETKGLLKADLVKLVLEEILGMERQDLVKKSSIRKRARTPGTVERESGGSSDEAKPSRRRKRTVKPKLVRQMNRKPSKSKTPSKASSTSSSKVSVDRNSLAATRGRRKTTPPRPPPSSSDESYDSRASLSSDDSEYQDTSETEDSPQTEPEVTTDSVIMSEDSEFSPSPKRKGGSVKGKGLNSSTGKASKSPGKKNRRKKASAKKGARKNGKGSDSDSGSSDGDSSSDDGGGLDFNEDEVNLQASPLHAIRWNRIILDEAHRIKSKNTSTAKAIFALRTTEGIDDDTTEESPDVASAQTASEQKALSAAPGTGDAKEHERLYVKYYKGGGTRWCMTGTPLQNRVSELYSLIRFVRYYPYGYYFCSAKVAVESPGPKKGKKVCDCECLIYKFRDGKWCASCGHTKMNHYSYFNKKIAKPIVQFGYAGEGRNALQALRSDVLDLIVLRRTKLERAEDVKLPPLRVMIRREKLSNDEIDFYNALYKQSKIQFDTYVTAGTVLHNFAHIFDLLSRLRQACDHPYLIIHGTLLSSQKQQLAQTAADSPTTADGAPPQSPLHPAAGATGSRNDATTEVPQSGNRKREINVEAAIPTRSRGNANTCSICLEDIDPTEQINSSCGHFFHRICIQEFLQSAPEGTSIGCPQCYCPMSLTLKQIDPVSDMSEMASETLKSSEVDTDAGASEGVPEDPGEGYRSASRGFGPRSILSKIKTSEFQSSTKIETLLGELEEAFEEDEGCKAIVFSQFTSMLELIEYRLKTCGIRCVVLIGSLSMAARQNILTAFHVDPTLKVILISLKAGGEGLNLQIANKIYLMDPWWNPAAEMQAIQRAHRIGQSKPVRAVRIIAAGTIEERILQLQEKKQLVFDGTVGSSAAAFQKLSSDDLRFLFG